MPHLYQDNETTMEDSNRLSDGTKEVIVDFDQLARRKEDNYSDDNSDD